MRLVTLVLLALTACAPSTLPPKVRLAVAPQVESRSKGPSGPTGGAAGRLLFPMNDALHLGVAGELLGDEAQRILAVARIAMVRRGTACLAAGLGVGDVRYPRHDVANNFIAQAGLTVAVAVADWLDWESGVHVTLIPTAALGFDGRSPLPLTSIGASTGLALLF